MFKDCVLCCLIINILVVFSLETTGSLKDASDLGTMAMPCTTSDGDDGFCMPLSLCLNLTKQLGKEAIEEYINRYKCGPATGNTTDVNVCCAKNNSFEESENEDQTLSKKCGVQHLIIQRIFGGTEAALGEFPWMARLIHKSKNGTKSFGCTGFLISYRFVLTAAHCLDSDNIKMLGPIFEVELGEHNSETEMDCSGDVCAQPVQKVRVRKTIVHPGYNKNAATNYDDIGLIYLKKSMNLTDWVYPICIQENPHDIPNEYVISGWGSTEYGPTSSIKMKVSLPPYSHDKCVDKFKKIEANITENQLCAGGEIGKDSCFGDSGGPLMTEKDGRYFAVGVVSFGIYCGRKDWPGVYTKISSYIDWIRDEKAKNGYKHKNKTSLII